MCKRNKFFVIILSALTALFVVFGFMSFNPQQQKTAEASYTFTESSDIYFVPGARASTESYDLNAISFWLVVNENLLSNNEVVNFSFIVDGAANLVSIVNSSSVSKKDFEVYEETDDAIFLYYDIIYVLPPTMNITAIAELNGTYVKSATRSIYYIWEAMYNNGDLDSGDYPEAFVEAVKREFEFTEEIVTAYSATETTNNIPFKLNKEVSFDDKNNLKFKFHLPNIYKDLMRNLDPYYDEEGNLVRKNNDINYIDKAFGSYWFNCYKFIEFTKYAVALLKYPVDGFVPGNENISDLVCGIYSLDDINRKGSLQYVTSGYNAGGHDIKLPDLQSDLLVCEDEKLSLYSLSVPVPEDLTTEYNYTLALVEIPYTTYISGWNIFGFVGPNVFWINAVNHKFVNCYVSESSWDDAKSKYDSYTENDKEFILCSSLDRCSNSVDFSIKSLAEEKLARNINMTDEQRAQLQDLAGIAPCTDLINVTVHYKEFINFGDVQDKTFDFNVKSIYAQNKNLILNELLVLDNVSSSLKGINYFDVVCKEYSLDTGNLLSERILMRANKNKSIYQYDVANEKYDLYIGYSTFDANEYTIRIQDNDLETGLVLPLYSTSIIDNEDGQIEITFIYDSLEEQYYSNSMLVFELDADCFDIENNTNGVCSVSVNDEYLLITCDSNELDALLNLSILAVVEIIEDFYASVEINYLGLELLDGEVKTNSLVLSQVPNDKYYDDEGNLIIEDCFIIMPYSELLQFSFVDLMNEYGVYINNAITLEEFNGYFLYTPSSCTRLIDAPERSEEGLYEGLGSCSITVNYNYGALFKISNNYDDEIVYKGILDNTRIYYGNYFVSEDKIPEYHRFSLIEVDKEYMSSDIVADYTKSKYTLIPSIGTSPLLIPVTINYVDSYNLSIEYLSNYKDTCFAEKKILDINVKIADYPDLFSLSMENLKSICNISDFSVLDSVTAIDYTIDFIEDEVAYKIELLYNSCNFKQTDSRGDSIQLSVPLTRFSDWVLDFGIGWTTLNLNRPDNLYFTSVDDIAVEDLYGFFTVAVYDTVPGSLNSYFKNVDGFGSVSIYNHHKVSGKDLYTFFGSCDNGILGFDEYTGMAFCEITNSNVYSYDTYFMYLDNNLENSYYGAVETEAGQNDSSGNTFLGIELTTENIIKLIVGFVVLILVLALLYYTGMLPLVVKGIAWLIVFPFKLIASIIKTLTSKKNIASKSKSKNVGHNKIINDKSSKK